MCLHIFVFYYVSFLVCVPSKGCAVRCSMARKLLRYIHLLPNWRVDGTRTPKGDSSPNLQSFRTMVPGEPCSSHSPSCALLNVSGAYIV